MGYPSALGAATSTYGTAPSGDNFVLDEVKCNGTELSIFDCPHKNELYENCNADEIIGVKCAKKAKKSKKANKAKQAKKARKAKKAKKAKKAITINLGKNTKKPRSEKTTSWWWW